MSDRYQFTHQQLDRLLNAAIELFIEYRDQHGHDEVEARPLAVSEVLEGLDAESELVDYGDLDGATLQERLIVGRKDTKAND